MLFTGMLEKRTHGRAIVVGGSIAGLLTARVLSDHFMQVTIVERDPVPEEPEVRKGQAHARHTHVLLEPTRAFIHRYLPQVEQGLLAGGAHLSDACEDVRWFAFGRHRLQVPAELPLLTATRSFLEYHIRKAVFAIPNVDSHDRTRVHGLLWNADSSQVVGVRIVRRALGTSVEGDASEVLKADLVVDTSGRGSVLPKWLDERGYGRPRQSEVHIGLSYATRLYRRQPAQARPQIFFTGGSPPADRLTAAMVPVEGDRWSLTLAGWHGMTVPSNGSSFLEAVRNLPSSDIYQAVASCEPLGEPFLFKHPSSRRFHYEGLRRFPQGIVALGDAAASFNPVYGQGISSAALQVEALEASLLEPTTTPLWRRFFARQARLVDDIWSIAVGEDFRFPETRGKKPLGTDIGNHYAEWAQRAAQSDGRVARQVVEVLCLRAPRSTLMRPSILWRVLKANAAGCRAASTMRCR